MKLAILVLAALLALLWLARNALPADFRHNDYRPMPNVEPESLGGWQDAEWWAA